MHLAECTKIVTEEQILLDVSSNASSATHGHPFFELVYVLSGSAEHTRDRKTTVIGQGDYFLINFHSMHSYRAIYGSSDFRIINCMFMPQFIDASLANARNFQDILNNYLLRFGYQSFSNSPTQSIYHDSDQRFRYLMTEMLHEYNTRSAGYMEIIRHFLLNAIIYLVRNETVSCVHRADEITHYIKEYIAKHYMETIRLSDITNEMGFSLSHASKIFKDTTRLTFRDYLQKYRVEKACQLLRGTDKNVAEISELVGYADPPFFYRAFKKLTQTTPLEYRRQHRPHAFAPE